MEIVVGEKTVRDLTKDDVLDFIYLEGYCGSPQYFDRPTIDYFSVKEITSEETLFFDVTQRQKKEVGKLEFNYRMHLTLIGNSPVLYSEKHGSYRFKLKEINYFLKRGFKINIEGVKDERSVATKE